MNQRIKKSWLGRLRSGEFKKGTQVLRDMDNRFCCLGVLCELYRQETGRGEWVPMGTAYRFQMDGYGSTNYLIKEVVDWAELDSHNPIVTDESGVSTLGGFNDIEYGGDLDFQGIARVIEENL